MLNFELKTKATIADLFRLSKPTFLLMTIILLSWLF